MVTLSHYLYWVIIIARRPGVIHAFVRIGGIAYFLVVDKTLPVGTGAEFGFGKPPKDTMLQRVILRQSANVKRPENAEATRPASNANQIPALVIGHGSQIAAL